MSQRIQIRRRPSGVSNGCRRLGRMKDSLQPERIEASLSIGKLQVGEQAVEHLSSDQKPVPSWSFCDEAKALGIAICTIVQV